MNNMSITTIKEGETQLNVVLNFPLTCSQVYMYIYTGAHEGRRPEGASNYV